MSALENGFATDTNSMNGSTSVAWNKTFYTPVVCIPGKMRRKRVGSEREMEIKVDDFLTRGYVIKQQGQYSTKMKEKDFGSAPVHGFTFLFSLLAAAVLFNAAGLSAEGPWVVAILASLTYAAYSRLTSEEVIITVKEDDASE